MRKSIMVSSVVPDGKNLIIGFAWGRKMIRAAKSVGMMRVSQRQFINHILPEHRKWRKTINGRAAHEFTMSDIPDLPEDISGQNELDLK